MTDRANYWRDQAMEWAQAARNLPMQGYVLLKKSQAAWDERDAVRMLTLAQAAQDGPWQLSARVRAEIAQQEARGHAMLDGNLLKAERKLDMARGLLADVESLPGGSDIAPHYNEALFAAQTAICYCVAGQPERALQTYDAWLSPEAFPPRDYGHLLALKSEAYALAGDADSAARSALESLRIAKETNSARTIYEVLRVAQRLRPRLGREPVRRLLEAVEV
jgi:tetratricopeptide (TPR) repeat protein